MGRAGVDGLLVIDKPQGITSRQAVDRAQRWFGRGTRLGHTGTLDPLATGVLVLCAGAATRLTEFVQDMGKTYFTTVRLGATSDTYDADGTITPVKVEKPPDRARLDAALAGFIGEIDQVPPAFSAAKVAGERAYDLARQGQEVVLRPRRVRIDGIDVRRFEYPEVDLEVRCGKGTYIRSLARDLGERLGTGGLVQVLRRTRVGPFHVEDAVPLDAETVRLLPLSTAVAELLSVTVDDREALALRNGRAVLARVGDGREFAVFDGAGRLVAVARREGTLLRPVKVLPV